jgi:hypothetical protein
MNWAWIWLVVGELRNEYKLLVQMLVLQREAARPWRILGDNIRNKHGEIWQDGAN